MPNISIPRPTRAQFWCLVAVLCGFSVTAPGVSAQVVTGNPNSPRGGGQGGVPAAVREAASRGGSVRVIIGLAVPVVPETLLRPDVRLEQRARLAAVQDAVAASARLPLSGARGVKRFRLVPAMGAEVDAAALDALASHPSVAFVEIDHLAAPSLAESVAIVGAPAVWASGFTGAGQTIAIIDTGVERTHPALAGKVVSEACFSTAQPGISESLCRTTTGVGAAEPCVLSSCWHGTHVAGIAVGDGAGVRGVAPGANIIAIQVFSRFVRELECGIGNAPCVLSRTSDQVLALERVYELRESFNIAAANLSLAGGRYMSRASCDAANATQKGVIDRLRAAGIATVASSGNDGYIDALSAPSCISSAISVGSTTDGSDGAAPADQVSSFTNSATFLDLLAPGQWVTSSEPGGALGTRAGTSMAAPHVSAGWALLKSAVPSASVTQVLDALRYTGTAVLDLANGVSKPRINLSAALSALVPTCTYDVSPSAFAAALPEGSSGSINVLTQPGCAWTARSDAPFIVITNGSSGVGPGTVTFVIVTSNPQTMPRSGTIVVAGRQISIAQAGGSEAAPRDFNRDGYVDLLWHHRGNGRIAGWLMRGLMVVDDFTPNPSQVPDTTWELAGAGDLDGDGHADLVWHNTVDGRVSAWLMTGLTAREATLLSIPQVPDTQWRIRSVGDMDLDGRADLIWQHEGDGSIAVWRMYGVTVLEATALQPGRVEDLGWRIVGSADFDGNGTRDLVWHHQVDGTVAVWFMRGLTLQSAMVTNPSQVPDTNWKIRGVGDLNRDGHPDLIWQHVGDGRVSAWLMNGLQLLEGTLLSRPQVPDTNWHLIGPR